MSMCGAMAKDWNAAYENDDMPWDKGIAAPPLREFLSTHPLTGRVLVPGCGLGHDVRLLAEQGASVIGVEIAPNAVHKASQLPVAADESYQVADFLNLPEHFHEQFDVVFEHTCLCALDREQRVGYARSVALALKPRGTYLAIFYRVVSDYDGEKPPHPISADEIDALFGADFEIIERHVPQETYPSRPVGHEEICLMRKR